MSDKKDDLSQFSMLDLFRMEADSQTQILTDGLLAFERRNDPAAVESMMRAAHSIKGAASIVGLEMIVQLAHGMEDAFIAAQAGKLKLTPNRVDALLAAVDLIVQCSRVNDDLDAWLAANSAHVSKTMNDVQGIAFLPEPIVLPSAVAAPPAPVPATAAETPAQAPAPLLAPEPAPSSSLAAEAPADGTAEPAIPGRSLPPMKTAQNFDRLLALASEARINAHQLHPLIQGMQRYKRNQAALFAVLEDVMEAASRTSDPALKEKALLAIQKSQPLKQFMLEHIRHGKLRTPPLDGFREHGR
jgi:two-component system, chemotaxis family, sensor histidine kinase and response regulator WspE